MMIATHIGRHGFRRTTSLVFSPESESESKNGGTVNSETVNIETLKMVVVVIMVGGDDNDIPSIPT